MAGIKERLIQVVLRGKDMLSGEAGKSAAALDVLRQTGEQLQSALGRTEGASKLASQLDQTRTVVERATNAYSKAQEDVARLREEMSAAPRGQLEASLKSAEQNARKAATEVRGLRKELAERPDDTGIARDLEQAERLAGEARAEVERLRTDLVNTPTDTGITVALKEAERSARASGRELDRLRETERELEQQARATGIATEDLGSEQDRLQREVDETKRALNENAEALDDLRRKQAAAAAGAAEHASRVSAAREAMSGGMRTVLGFAAAYVSLDAAIGLASRAVDAIRAGIGNMLQAGDGAEALQDRMTSLMGSIAAGEQATAWISDFAKRTPLATAEVADAFMLLKSYGLDPMDGTLQALVDKNEQLGGGMDRLTGITTAVGQAFAKSKLQTEEILQLVERGVPAWDLLAKVTGKNAAQLEQLASEGRLGRDVIKALVAELGKSADGAAAEGMSRLSGLMSQLSDTAGDFYKRIANAVALDFVKGKLQSLIDTIGQMDKDGRLDKLARSLSEAFIQGAEKIEEFGKKLVGVDFSKLADDSSAWLSNFGRQIDEVSTRVQLFTAPFRTLFNGVTAGFATLTLSFSGFLEAAVAGLQQVAKAVPDMFGGADLRKNLAGFRAGIDAMQAGLVAQIEQDGQDIRNAWDTTGDHVVSSSQKAADAQKAAASEAKDAWQQAAEAGIVSNDEMRAAIVQAAIDGTQAIADMAGAMELIDSASTVQQLDGLRTALLTAYQDGKLSIEQYQQSTGLLNARLTEISKGASDTADAVSDLSDQFESLADVQQAIASAQTDVDINAIKKALRELYEGGKISAAEYNEELQNVTARQKELKGAVEQTASAGRQAGEQLTKSQQMYNKALEDSILTNEELRRISGQRMEEERRASGELMEMQRKGQVVVERDMSAMEDFFGGVMTRAREPLAQMSAAALEAYDKLLGISTTSVGIDTSGLEATRASLRGVSDELAGVQMAQIELLSKSNTGFSKWMLGTQEASLRTQQAYLGQKASLQSLMERYENGTISLKSFIAAAKGSASSLNLLDDSDLSSLESAIASAEQRMQALGDSTRNTLEGLQSELDQLQGREDAVEARRFAQRKRELQAQLEEARASGDSGAITNLSRAMQVLREIQTETEQQRIVKAQQERQQQPAAPAAAQPVQQPATVIRLETTRGQRVDVSVPQGQQTQLLDILNEAGLRTI